MPTENIGQRIGDNMTMGSGEMPTRTLSECEKHCSDILDRETENQLLITKLQAEIKHTEHFYLPRMERIKDFLKENNLWNNESASIFANGTSAPNESPTYSQKISLLNYEIKKLQAQLAKSELIMKDVYENKGTLILVNYYSRKEYGEKVIRFKL